MPSIIASTSTSNPIDVALLIKLSSWRILVTDNNTVLVALSSSISSEILIHAAYLAATDMG